MNEAERKFFFPHTTLKLEGKNWDGGRAKRVLAVGVSKISEIDAFKSLKWINFVLFAPTKEQTDGRHRKNM